MRTSQISSMFLISVIAIAGIGVSYSGLTDYIQIYGKVSVATVEMDIETYSGTWVWKVWNDDGVPDPPYEDEAFIYHGDVGTEPSMADVLSETGADYAELVSWAYGRDWMEGDPVMDSGEAYDGILEFYNMFPGIEFHADIVFHYIGSIPAKIQDIKFTWEGEIIELPDGTFGDWLNYLWLIDYFWYQIGEKPLPLQIHYCDRIYFDCGIKIPQDDRFQGLTGKAYLSIELLQWNDDCQPPGDKIINIPDPEGYVAYCDWTGSPGPLYGTTFDAFLTGIPYEPDYNVWNWIWPCWCIEEDPVPQDGYVQLWSSYDPNIPLEDEDWDLVNYIINHYHVDDIIPQGTVTYIKLQDAIWRFINGGYSGTDPVTNAIIDDALANGEGFIPQSGQDCAILLWPVNADGTDRYGCQYTFIVVDP